MTMEVENSRIYADIELFKGDFCGRLSPDLLQQREINTQTDDESSSDCSVHSADTVLQKSLNNVDVDGSLTGDEKIDQVHSLSIHLLSSEEDNYEPPIKLSTRKRNSPLLVESVSNLVKDSYSSSEEGTSCTLTEDPNTSKNKFTSKERSVTSKNPGTSVNKISDWNDTISSSEEVIPPSPVHIEISSDTSSIKTTKQRSKKNKKIIELNYDDSTDQLSDNETMNKQETVQRRTKKNKPNIIKKVTPKKLRPKGNTKIVMNKVVYPSSYPTSAEESLSDDSSIISNSRTKTRSVRNKLIQNKRAQNRASDIISLSEND